MKYRFGKVIVISLGGSIIYPDIIDISYVKKFRTFVLSHLKNGKQFVVVCGGGKLARIFQDAAGEITSVTHEDKDWIGIHSTRLNAQLLRTVFKKEAAPVVFDHRRKIKKITHPVTIASGWHPGWSTDFVAAAIAKDFRIAEYIEAGKPAYVYDKDPFAFKGAKRFEDISWKEYRGLIPAKWIPGSHAPVDPVAAKLSDNAGIKSIVVDGRDIENFNNLICGRNFRGTIIG